MDNLDRIQTIQLDSEDSEDSIGPKEQEPEQEIILTVSTSTPQTTPRTTPRTTPNTTPKFCRRESNQIGNSGQYCTSCKKLYSVGVIGSTLSECAMCAVSRNNKFGPGIRKSAKNSNSSEDFSTWKDFAKGWSGL